MELSLSVSVLSADNNTVKGGSCNVQMPLTLRLLRGWQSSEENETERKGVRATAEE